MEGVGVPGVPPMRKPQVRLGPSGLLSASQDATPPHCALPEVKWNGSGALSLPGRAQAFPVLQAPLQGEVCVR